MNILFKFFFMGFELRMVDASLSPPPFHGRKNMMKGFMVDNVGDKIVRNMRRIEVAIDADKLGFKVIRS
jgi:hypothetical protein